MPRHVMVATLSLVLALVVLSLPSAAPVVAQDDETPIIYPADTFVGTATADILASYHPDFPNECRIRAGERVLAVGADADRELLLVYAGGLGCEGPVWLPLDTAVSWDTPRIDPPSVSAPPSTQAISEIDDYDALCAAANAGTAPRATRTAAEVTQIYMPGAFSWLPPQFLATEGNGGPDAVLCLQREVQSIGVCANLNTRVERFREAALVTLVDYRNGGIIAQQRFDGAFPQDCPRAANSDYNIYGSPVARETWAAWLIGRLRLVEGDALRSTTLVPRLNARAESNTQSAILDTLAQGSPVNIIARNAAGTWYVALLPDMRRAWLFADFVRVAAQTPIEALPVVGGPAEAVALP